MLSEALPPLRLLDFPFRIRRDVQATYRPGAVQHKADQQGDGNN